MTILKNVPSADERKKTYLHNESLTSNFPKLSHKEEAEKDKFYWSNSMFSFDYAMVYSNNNFDFNNDQFYIQISWGIFLALTHSSWLFAYSRWSHNASIASYWLNTRRIWSFAVGFPWIPRGIIPQRRVIFAVVQMWHRACRRISINRAIVPSRFAGYRNYTFRIVLTGRGPQICLYEKRTLLSEIKNGIILYL